MNNKFIKYLGYTFLISLVLFFILNSADTEANPWTIYAKMICFILAIIVAIIYLSILIYCVIDNKKISNLLDNDKFDELLAYSKKKENKKRILLSNRKSYYQYLQLLCYLAKDELDKAEEYFVIVEKDMYMYPMTYYWKAILNFTKNDNSTLEENYNNFKNSPDIIKGRGKYDHLTALLYVLVLFNNGEINKAKEKLLNIDTKGISMPITLRAIKIIEDTEITTDIECVENIQGE